VKSGQQIYSTKTVVYNETKRICLWSTPRNVSTALMYSFLQRSDTTVVDEPLYSHYLKTTGALHPGREEILENMENDGEKVVKNVMLKTYTEPLVFFKQMTHHLQGINLDFLNSMKNVLLIRNPFEIINSYIKVHPTPTIDDIGMKHQFELFEKLKKRGNPFAVIDSKFLLKNPRQVLKKLCAELNISFNPNMLAWEPGARNEDGIWAKYWYENVHKSSGFMEYKRRVIELPLDMEKLAEECFQYYQPILEEAIQS
jgi:hypothetical protein